MRSSLYRSFIRLFRQACQANGTSLQPPSSMPRMRRRRFLKYAALAGGSAIAATTLPRLATADTQPTIAIIGSGLSGLNTAYQLQLAGLTATVYEAKSRPGGRIHSVTGTVGRGLTIELGAELINTDHADVLALVEDFGLTLYDRSQAAQADNVPLNIYIHSGRKLTESEMVEAFRPIAAQILEDSQRLDEDWDRYAPDLDQLSVTDYLNQYSDRIPEPYVRHFLEATIRSEYGVEPTDSSALQLIVNLVTITDEGVNLLGGSDEMYTVEGGTERIITALSDRLSGQIQFNKRLTHLRTLDQQYQLTFGDGSQAIADIVVVAIPFPVLREVNLEVDLPRKFQRFIAEAGLGLNEKVLVGFRERVWQQSQSFVEAAWADFGFTEVWDATLRQSDRPEAALTFYLGGQEVTNTHAIPARALADQFLQDMESYVPGLTAAQDRTARTYWYNDRFVRGGYSTFKPGQYTTFGKYFYIDAEEPSDRQEVVFDNLFFVGEHLSDAYYGYMNGAAETGRMAAESIVRRLG